ncbi:MAG: DUF3786 domain-containing protein [Thermodesulfobacteriota bacterium]|nr:DUF3786 domain-containing protein [Thermodesulfobacteriota bacterium]
MALSALDLYRDVLPQTNCGECGYATCLAFASMVVSEQLPLEKCPYVSADMAAACEDELAAQYAAGRWTKRDMAEDALQWAQQRSASMNIEDMPGRIGGRILTDGDAPVLALPYFNRTLLIAKDSLTLQDGSPLTRWEQVFILNHMAQGGSAEPTGKWKGLKEFPNTVSKIKSMKTHVEDPLKDAFSGRIQQLRGAAETLGARDMTLEFGSADAALCFQALPKVPVMLMFWDAEPEDGFEAEARLLFDETITDHLDIESIMFLSERLKDLLCEVSD